MHIYRFVKYNALTNSEHLEKYIGSDAVICFDLEDSVSDWVNPQNTPSLKSKARINLDRILCLIEHSFPELQVCVRINFPGTEEFEKDIGLLAGRKINSVFVSKITDAGQVSDAYRRLTGSGIQIKDFIPVIESKRSLENIENIVKDSRKYFSKLVFGHYDYNLSINALPFFHQYNNEYWKWVNRITGVTSGYGKIFINSVFLYLKDPGFFSKMLSHLDRITGGNFGQVTMNSQQTELCRHYDKNLHGFRKLTEDRSELWVPDNYANEYIKQYENKKIDSVTPENGNGALMSPHEYISAKNHLKTKKHVSKKLVFAGGCFPVQYNILFEDLFHQTLKKLYVNKHNIELKIKLVRYERFTNCLTKISSVCGPEYPDFIVLHIRPEPFFRSLKLYYKYRNYTGDIKKALSLPFLNIVKPEEFDVYDIERNFPNYARFDSESEGRSLRTDINYMAGILTGNLYYSVKKYIVLISEVRKYCKQGNTKLIILGPPERLLSKSEPFFCRYLAGKVEEFCSINDVVFINGLSVSDKENRVKIMDHTGKFATKEYHDFVAEKLFAVLELPH